MEQLNNQFELENIKKKLLMTYTRYNATNIPYTDEELLKAAIQIKSFFDKLNNTVTTTWVGQPYIELCTDLNNPNSGTPYTFKLRFNP